MADEVVKAPEVTPVEAPKAETEKKPVARGRKKGTATKAATTKKTETVAKKPGRKPGSKTTTKKADKKPAVNVAPALDLNYKGITIEFNDKKYSQKDLFARVNAYIKHHPYIVAHDIELFIKPDESCCYFTVDGFSNPDFRIDL
ncbi:hypothetical protein BXO88_10955 [Oribacterium sp. C9]|uniref:DUF6465 family protein n=1 Tax=Oribacterium sp. C9 TaxID=1943579 RepID=UPI00098F2BF5|nr:DUF6465 family protein [Oribacterium sp. C9]OON85767.1 hypothetical protein BXO88_10955 [Oribacterium sp. C9]